MPGEPHQSRLRWLAAKARSQADEPFTDDLLTDMELREIAAELESGAARDDTAELVEALSALTVGLKRAHEMFQFPGFQPDDTLGDAVAQAEAALARHRGES